MTAKEKIVEAGIYLFNTNGFAATSIRDIANRAKVNSANISYYFQGKNGLLEYCIIHYFEQYLVILENYLMKVNRKNNLSDLVQLLLNFHFNNRQLSRLVLREMSLDNQMVREVMATYLMKEKYIFQTIFQQAIQQQGGKFNPIKFSLFLVEFKGLMSAPFLNPHYLREVLYIYPSDQYFMDEYQEEICMWINDKINATVKKKEVS